MTPDPKAKALAVVLVVLSLSCAARTEPAAHTVEVRYEPCRTVVTLGVDLSHCRWTEQPIGVWSCEGARPIVTEERAP